MNYGEGLISKVFSWVWHASNSDESMTDWIAFLVVAILAGYLWSTVIKAVD